MAEKIGRNDFCPCGSGKKFKKCCMVKEQDAEVRRREEKTAVPRTLDWLSERYSNEVAEAVHAEFYGGLEDEELDRLNELSRDFQQMIFINVGEWLINDGSIEVRGQVTPVKEILLGPGGPLYTAAARNWLERLGERSLSLYEVVRVTPGEGIELIDLLRPAEPPVWVVERTASRTVVPHDIFGTRLVRTDSGLVMSGAAYPFTREEGLACRDHILQVMKMPGWTDDQFRDAALAMITTSWLSSLVAERPMPKLVDSSTGNAIMLTTDRYRVKDWVALEKVLAAQPDVEGDRSEGWVRFAQIEREMQRSLASCNPKGATSLEVFCRTVELADETRQWLERVAAGVVEFKIRELVDPRSEKARDFAAAGPKKEPSLELDNEVLNELMRNIYANWTEEPIPALGNKTPRAAIKTEKGRRAVIDLLHSYENNEARRVRDQGGEPFDFGFMWERLGLKREPS
uniref:SEC-C motif domain protein n=1 Tax=Geobacter sp. (strain M21) TaxID=443144 RepID=C6E3T5_GEOSM